MGGCCSSGPDKGSTGSGHSSKFRDIDELVKVDSIEQANALLRDDHIFIAVFYNQQKSREEYILGRMEKHEECHKSIGFKIG